MAEMKCFVMLLSAASLALAQEALTLKEAVREALKSHPSQKIAAAEVRGATARVAQARAAYLPRATYSEFVQSGNQPVFAFGSFLNQRRFAEENFAIDALNHPGFVTNFQSQIVGEQTIWDFKTTATSIRAAEIGKTIAEESERLARQRRVAEVARTYHAVTLAEEGRKVAEAAVRAAKADLARAEAVRDAGMSTDADVLSVRVHLAAMLAQEINRRYDAQIALAALNEALGAPMDTPRQMATQLAMVCEAPAAAGERPEMRQARSGRELGVAQRSAAGKALLPKVVARGVFEADRGRFATQGGANWFFGVGLQWNVFDASTRRKVEEADAAVAAAEAREAEVAAQISLQVRQAQASLASAGEQLSVTEAAVSQAQESARIIRNRYEAGLARIDELLRNEVALVETQLRRLQAVYNQRVAAVAVELASGALTEDSHVLD